MSKVFIATPIMRELDGRAILYGRALQSILQLEWPGQIDHFISNGGDDYSSPNGTVTAKYNLARDVFLAGRWEWFLAAEYDMVVPPDGLKRLVELDTDIAYGVYAFRHGKRDGKYRWSAATKLEGRSVDTIASDPERARKYWGEAVNVKGIGMGFTLIKRHVIEAAPFRVLEYACCDWALALDAQANGWQQQAHLGVPCGHMTKAPSPRILWPDPDEPEMARVEFL
ncbi:MAG: hypothetical protein IT320_20835 [Anaerolineae bacterium]|nr:hypothetical protein [Anaerolineae bacterium]